MANQSKIGWSKWTSRIILFLIPVSAIILGTLFFYDKLDAHHLWGTAIIFLGLTALNGKIWPCMWRAFLKYMDNDIKMMPHL